LSIDTSTTIALTTLPAIILWVGGDGLSIHIFIMAAVLVEAMTGIVKSILVSLVMSRGSNAIHDLLKKLNRRSEQERIW